MALVSAGACPPALLGGRAVRRLSVRCLGWMRPNFRTPLTLPCHARTKTFARNGFGSGGFAIGLQPPWTCFDGVMCDVENCADKGFLSSCHK